MSSLNAFKLLGFFAFALFIVSACRFWQSETKDAPDRTPFAAEELKSEIPFAAKEPENFQAEIVITAGNQENRIFVARNGNNRRYDYNSDAKNKLSFWQTDKKYLILADKKVYAESPATENYVALESWTDFLTTEWLNAKTGVKFFKLESENNLAKYRVSFGDAESAKSESLIFIDEAQNLIVRQEFYDVSGEQKTLTMTVELKNLKLETAPDLFALPKDYRKISLEELRKILQSENSNE